MSVRKKYEEFKLAVSELIDKEMSAEFLSKESYTSDEAFKLSTFSVGASAILQLESIILEWLDAIEEYEDLDE